MNEHTDQPKTIGPAHLSRRDVLAGTTALGMSGLLVSGARAQTPKRGGHLIIGVDGGSSGDTLDPARITSVFHTIVMLQFYDTLTILDDQGRISPLLAESWDAKPGAKEWTLKLRKGVMFHNGKELTSADVVYSINH